MSYTEHNQQKRNEYWNNFNKTGQHYTLARCYYSVSKPTKFEDIIETIKNTMYAKNKKERQELGMGIISLFFNDEIDYIFENRIKIAEQFNCVSLINYKLFNWMKLKNKEIYTNFKYYLSEILKKKINFDEIKSYITYEIYHYLSKYYIKL